MLDAVIRTSEPLTDDQRYDAFQRRDGTLRNAFVMAVVTTGIYCRAGCPARTPRRENVRFFEDGDDARAAGFRACKRCVPDEVSPRGDLIARACRFIEEAETPPSLAQLANRLGLSPFHFHRVFRTATGLTPAAWASALRDRRAKAALSAGASVTEAVYEGGYSSASRFYDKAEARFGMKPRAWRDRGAGERIRVATAPCALGHVLVAATDRGLCVVELGDDPASLVGCFRERFSRAELTVDDSGLTEHVAQVVRKIAEPGATVDLPLDVRGTVFQQRVWEALRRIPAGETRTYAQVAEAIGAPRAVRAVGAACGANPVAVVTPCHRVVGSDGRLTGYRWGVERKRKLLDHERG